MGAKYDFSGYATKNDLRCSDGRTIRRDAFKENDGQTVPLVWQHRHDDPENVIGHALLENREDGVYAYGSFNDTPKGRTAKALVQHGDVDALSIYANKLKQNGGDVLHGIIREVSLVLAGANPGASIEFPILEHSGEEIDTEAKIYTGSPIYLEHSDKEEDEEEDKKEEKKSEEEEEPDKEDDEKKEDEDKDSSEEEDDEKEEEEMAHEDKTVKDVFDEFTDEQKDVVYFMIGQALEDAGVSDEGEEGEESEEMKHNVFDNEYTGQNYLSHSDMQNIFDDARKCGSLREAVDNYIEDGVLTHSIPHPIPTEGMEVPDPSTADQTYGFRDPNMLFPEYKALNNQPEWLKRDTSWVTEVMNGAHHTPFSRIKSVFADITEDDARARGYMKGKLKKEEVFTLLKRKTDPQTIYKKQKLDRDDIVDITDFDVVSWIRAEMRVMLDEEIARAILIGDGRPTDSDDHISEEHVRPIATDKPLFSVPVSVAGGEKLAKNFINECIRARKLYKGTGTPTLFTTADMHTEMLLIEDELGHKLYKSDTELATALRVSKIVEVEVMEGHQIDDKNLLGIIVNMSDYNIGADKGGEINMFDDFDIDYNQMKYLIETRISGALIKPFSALVITEGSASNNDQPQG